MLVDTDVINNVSSITVLADMFAEGQSAAVLTGAGCSTASGIPDYRDQNGEWKNAQPMQFSEYMLSDANRQRYWKRSLVGWQRFSRAEPGLAHRSLATLEAKGYLPSLITQNVDGLHQKAGHQQVIDLHGRLDEVICTQCTARVSRHDFQNRMLEANPLYTHWLEHLSDNAMVQAPDGDVLISNTDIKLHTIPCENCAGIMKPAVVFFGESVPKHIVSTVKQDIEKNDIFIIVGSSLMVFSGFRFCRYAAELGKPVFILGYGKTRGDALATLKIEGECGALLNELCINLEQR